MNRWLTGPTYRDIEVESPPLPLQEADDTLHTPQVDTPMMQATPDRFSRDTTAKARHWRSERCTSCDVDTSTQKLSAQAFIRFQTDTISARNMGNRLWHIPIHGPQYTYRTLACYAQSSTDRSSVYTCRCPCREYYGQIGCDTQNGSLITLSICKFGLLCGCLELELVGVAGALSRSRESRCVCA